MRYSAGNSLRLLRSPVAPNSTSASAAGWLGAVLIGPSPPCARRTRRASPTAPCGRRRRDRVSRTDRTARRRAWAPARPRRSRRGCVQRPSPLSLTWPSNASRLGSACSACGGEIEQPTGHHAAAAPHLGDRREVDVVPVVLGVGERRGLGVLGVRLAADVGLGQHVQPLGVRGHHPVLDAVVDHLHEVAGADSGRSAASPARPGAGRPCGPACGVRSRCRGRATSKTASQLLHRLRRARRPSGSSRARGRTRRRWCRRRGSGCPWPPTGRRGRCRRGTTSCRRR